MDSRIARTLAAMHDAFSTELSIANLARTVNLSPSRFAHKFRHEVGTSPRRYLRALRMTWARIMLERTHLSIKEVMVHVGCGDPSHFTRDFYRFHGCTPRQWRAGASARDHAADTQSSLEVAHVAALAKKR